MAKAIIRMEVSCGCCGGVIGWDYHNAKSISKLKNATKDWRRDNWYGNICPDCVRKLQDEAKLKEMGGDDNGD